MLDSVFMTSIQLLAVYGGSRPVIFFLCLSTSWLMFDLRTEYSVSVLCPSSNHLTGAAAPPQQFMALLVAVSSLDTVTTDTT